MKMKGSGTAMDSSARALNAQKLIRRQDRKFPPQQMPGDRKILLHPQLEATAKSEENKDEEEGETSTRHPGPVFEALAGLAETGRHSASLLLDLSPWQKEVVVGLTGDCPSHHERCDLGQLCRL